MDPDGTYEADYIVSASVEGTLGLILVNVAISDTARSAGTFVTRDSLLVLSGSGSFVDSLLYTAQADTLRLIQEVPLGTYATTV